MAFHDYTLTCTRFVFSDEFPRLGYEPYCKTNPQLHLLEGRLVAGGACYKSLIKTPSGGVSQKEATRWRPISTWQSYLK